MPRVAAAALVMLGAMAWGAAGSESPPPGPKASDRLAPVVVGTDDLRTPVADKKPPAAPAKPASTIGVDDKTGAVRIPVAPTRARGVVEWLLSSGRKHPAVSVLVTEHSAKDLAAALAKAAYKPGTRPVPVGSDRARPPAGPAVEIDLVVTAPDGKESRTPAARLLASSSGGEPLGEGAWVYVGPQTLREGDADILVTELSGSIVTTNLRDSSAVVYWVPKGEAGSEGYVRTYYAAVPPPAAGCVCELEIRPVSPRPEP